MKDYSHQCNYCLSRLICFDRPKSTACAFCDNEQYFKECIYSLGDYFKWREHFNIVRSQQEENMYDKQSNRD